MIKRVLAALTMALAAWVADAPAQTTAVDVSGDVEGIYKVQGENYEGNVAISRNGQSYVLTWTIGGAIHHGIGMQKGKLLASSWPGGVVVYEIQADRRLSGQYPDRDGMLHRETLTFLRPLSAMSPP